MGLALKVSEDRFPVPDNASKRVTQYIKSLGQNKAAETVTVSGCHGREGSSDDSTDIRVKVDLW